MNTPCDTLDFWRVAGPLPAGVEADRSGVRAWRRPPRFSNPGQRGSPRRPWGPIAQKEGESDGDPSCHDHTEAPPHSAADADEHEGSRSEGPNHGHCDGLDRRVQIERAVSSPRPVTNDAVQSVINAADSKPTNQPESTPLAGTRAGGLVIGTTPVRRCRGRATSRAHRGSPATVGRYAATPTEA